MSTYTFEYKAYRRPFSKPLRGAQSVWNVREGILLRLQSPIGGIGYGEIAPIESFGTESFAEALAFCESKKGIFDPENLDSMGESLPCCQFAFRSALQLIEDPVPSPQKLPVAKLLASGEDTFAHVQLLLAKGYTVFKKKIGVGDTSMEIEAARRMLDNGGLGEKGCKLRLDANASFDRYDLERWLSFLDEYDTVEFLEQPLPVGAEEEMMAISKDFRTPIVLDESITGVSSLAKILSLGWDGLFILKPALMSTLKGIDASLADRIIYSSALETSIGFEASLRLISGNCARAIGYGVSSCFFDDGLFCHKLGPVVESGVVNSANFDQIWSLVR